MTISKLFGKALLGERRLVPCEIRFSDKIESIKKLPSVGKTAPIIAPGFIDVHTHGAMMAEAMDADERSLSNMAAFHLKKGTTGFLPTLMSACEEKLMCAAMTVAHAMETDSRILGLNLEGPFLSQKKRGAHDLAALKPIDMALFERLSTVAPVRLITVAPELDNALLFIEEACKKTVVSLGHSNADYETARAAFEIGAKHVTHLFNAMPPFLHRDPGLFGAAIDFSASAELILDLIHIDPSVARAAFRLFSERLVLISDSIFTAGLENGEYTKNNITIYLKNAEARLKDGTLAGSSIGLIDAVKNAVAIGIPIERALYAASVAPAKAIGVFDERGSIEEGKRADLVILNAKLDIVDVFLSGESVYEKPAKRAARKVALV
ncbi:MAG: N-acetylglucosamine-6-phosphate deacetylase [Clostridia bacterium]